MRRAVAVPLFLCLCLVAGCGGGGGGGSTSTPASLYAGNWSGEYGDAAHSGGYIGAITMQIAANGTATGRIEWTNTNSPTLYHRYEFTSANVDANGLATITCQRAGDSQSQAVSLQLTRIGDSIRGEGTIVWYNQQPPLAAVCRMYKQ